MPNFFYIDSNGQKQGPVDDQLLRTLATQNKIRPDTPMETDTGYKGVAGQIPGLFPDVPAPFTQAASVTTPHAANIFCTNCGNSTTENAVACMSCGASPVGHRKFCRQCGVGLNPEQIICIKCGSAINNAAAPRSIGGNATAGTLGSSPKNRITAAILAWFLGVFGVHWFYLGEKQKAQLYLGLGISGVVLLIFIIGFIPLCIVGVLALIDAVKLLMMSDEEFAAKYP